VPIGRRRTQHRAAPPCLFARDSQGVGRGTSPKLPKSEQDAAVERVVHTDELTARPGDAILVIVFGQHIEDVIQLTWTDVTVTDDVVTVRLGKTES